MKFLVDNQLPPALAEFLRQQGFDANHVFDRGLDKATDREICQHAEATNRVIISKDEDFLHLVSVGATSARLIWVRLGNSRTTALVAAFRALWPSIKAALDEGEQVVEIR